MGTPEKLALDAVVANHLAQQAERGYTQGEPNARRTPADAALEAKAATAEAGGSGGAGDVNNLLKQSTCSPDDFYRYLKNINSDYADNYVKTGKWPSDIQIPKSPDVLNADGSINWGKAPKGGYVLDSSEEAIKEEFIPDIGEIIDRHGPNNGRFTSPIRNGKPYTYAQRSLPYLENPSQYQRYKIVGDLSKIEQYFNRSTDMELKQAILAYMRKFRLIFSDLKSYRGQIASAFGSIGGGEQYELPLPVDMLEGLDLLRKFYYGG